MKFTPLSNEEIQLMSLLPEGIYSYEIVSAKDEISKVKNNEYISLNIKIWDANGREFMLYSNLVFIKLIKHFCEVNGLENEYQSGELLAKHCIGKSGGKLVLGIKKESPDGKGGMYPAKNIVKDYIQATHSTTNPIGVKSTDDFIDSDIPF